LEKDTNAAVESAGGVFANRAADSLLLLLLNTSTTAMTKHAAMATSPVVDAASCGGGGIFSSFFCEVREPRRTSLKSSVEGALLEAAA